MRTDETHGHIHEKLQDATGCETGSRKSSHTKMFISVLPEFKIKINFGNVSSILYVFLIQFYSIFLSHSAGNSIGCSEKCARQVSRDFITKQH